MLSIRSSLSAVEALVIERGTGNPRAKHTTKRTLLLRCQQLAEAVLCPLCDVILGCSAMWCILVWKEKVWTMSGHLRHSVWPAGG